MPKGLSIPVMPNVSGGANIEEEPQHTNTILKLALSVGGDDNAFQVLGLSEEIIFRINDPAVRGLARRSVENIIRKFNDRIVRDPSMPINFSINEEGQLNVEFRYVDLSTNRVNDFNEVIGG